MAPTVAEVAEQADVVITMLPAKCGLGVLHLFVEPISLLCLAFAAPRSSRSMLGKAVSLGETSIKN